jgi:hypothetical protein
MAGFSVELARALANGDQKVTGFTGGVRNLDNPSFEKGDTFTIPETFEVYEHKIGENKAQYIFVQVGENNTKQFYPSTLTKSRLVYNEDGTPTTNRVHTMGTAAELFRTAGSVEEGMNLLKGKTLKISDIQTIRTIRYGTTSLMNTQIPVIDIVEK